MQKRCFQGHNDFAVYLFTPKKLLLKNMAIIREAKLQRRVKIYQGVWDSTWQDVS